MAIWWELLALMLEALDFPFRIPLGDISWIIKGANKNLSDDISVV